jgi:hypothetical protein
MVPPVETVCRTSSPAPVPDIRIDPIWIVYVGLTAGPAGATMAGMPGLRRHLKLSFGEGIEMRCYLTDKFKGSSFSRMGPTKS